MRRTLTASLMIAAALVASRAPAQVATPDPDLRGPARRATGAAAEALGAPGVENRIENREQRRDLRNADVNPNAAARANAHIADGDRWRYAYHNNLWWYYTPQKTWMTYRDNNWSVYTPPIVTGNGIVTRNNSVPRYTTGYRGVDDGVYTRRGMFGRRTYYNNPNYSNPNRAASAGANLGADLGAAAGAAGAQSGANLGEAVGETIDAARNTMNPPLPPAVPQDAVPQDAPAGPVLNTP